MSKAVPGRPLKRKLLASCSLVTLLLGAGASSASAACVPVGSPGINNTGAVSGLCVTNTSFTGSISNSGTISPSGISLTNGTLAGQIASSGTINGGISIDRASALTIGGTAIKITGPTLAGGIANAGTIGAGGDGILVSNVAVFGSPTAGGGISNSGRITAGSTGVRAAGVSTFSGGMTNSGTISASGPGMYALNVSTFSGGLLNSGTVTAGRGGGVYANTISTFTGGLTNTGSISAGSGIYAFTVSSFSGGISNSGTISGSNTGISVQDVSTFSGGMTNSGSITAGRSGIYAFQDSTFSGGISNSGTISVSLITGMFAIAVSTFSGSLINSGTITAGYDAMEANFDNVFTGGISNSGMLIVGHTGIGVFSVSTFLGAITNAGTISAPLKGILVSSVAQFGSNSPGGGIINTGTITAGQADVFVTGISTFNGGITNVGVMTGNTGILVKQVSTFSGAIANTGMITGTGGTAIDINDNNGNAITIDQLGGTIAGAIKLSPNADTVAVAGGTINGNIMGAGTSNTLRFGLGTGTFTYGAAYSFTGINLVTVASGNVILEGTNSASNVVVNGGALQVGDAGNPGATLTSTTPIDVFGRLSGHGTVNGGATIENGGTLSPGGSVGTLTINGNLSFSAGSIYALEIASIQASKTQVNGLATLGGATVNAIFAPGAYVTKQYTILTATGGVTGAFASLVNTNLPGGITDVLTYDADDVYLNITKAPLPPATNRNQQAVYNALSNSFNTAGGLPGAFATLTTAQLSLISGEGIAAAQNVAHRSAAEFTSAIFDQTTFYGPGQSTPNSITLTDGPPPGTLAYAPTQAFVASFPIRPHDPVTPIEAPRTWRAWAVGFGGAETIGGNAGIGSAGQSDTIYGGVLGVDYQLTPDYRVGVAVGGSDGSFNVAGRATYGSTTGGHIAFYDLATFGSFYGASSNSVSFFTNRTTRTVTAGVASEVDHGNFDSHEFRSRLEFGRRFSAYGATITPFVALEIAELRSNGFNESNYGGPTLLGLNVQGQSSASVPGFVGARFQGATNLGNGMILSPTLQVAYVHEFSPERSQTAGFIALPGSTFLVDGARASRDAAQVKVGTELAIGPRSTLFVNFDGEFAGQTHFYGGKGGLKYTW